MSQSRKHRGYATQRIVAEYLREQGWEHALPVGAGRDGSDITGIKGLAEAKAKTSVQGGGNLRRRWKDKKGRIYEWDYQHGELEKYDKFGNHMGAFNPKTGLQIKPAIKNRKITP